MELVLAYIIIAVLGLVFGSFLNLLSDRLPFGEDVIKLGSHCDICKKPLGILDLVPVLSFCWLRGRCRYCKTKLSLYYPLSEIATAGVFLLIVYKFGILQPLLICYLLVMGSIFITILLADLKYCIIPDLLVVIGISMVFIFNAITIGISYYTTRAKLLVDPLGEFLVQSGYLNEQLFYLLQRFGSAVISALLIGVFFFLLIWFTKGRGMGWGDLKLGILIGLFNGGYMGFLAIFLGFLFGAVFSTILILLRKKTLKDTIPFGPFLILGSLVAYFWGNSLLAWYISLG